MYTENLLRDAVLVVRACLSNQLARVAPALYNRLTGQTGRGAEEGASADEIAQYFRACFDDYRTQLGLDTTQFGAFLRGRSVLEYGPGDTLGVALLMYAHGAATVDCVDRFELSQASAKSIAVYRSLLAALTGVAAERARRAFRVHGDPASGFAGTAIRYRVTASGLSGATDAYDLVISRAVLEHVDDLALTFRDIALSLREGGVSLHQVDLKSHGLDRYRPFDFLTWPDGLYRLMFDHKGFPNRWRVNKYRELAGSAGLRITGLQPTGRLDEQQVEFIRPRLARHLAGVTTDELSWLGFWIVLQRNDGSVPLICRTPPRQRVVDAPPS